MNRTNGAWTCERTRVSDTVYGYAEDEEERPDSYDGFARINPEFT